MAQYGFYFDSTRCTGCKTCEMACKDYKDLASNITFRHVYDYESGSVKLGSDGTCPANDCVIYHVSISCNHCDDPACAKVCPTGAMHKDAETGIVDVDAAKCIGCGYCHMACPYSAPTVDRKKGHSVKCDGCADRVAEGKAPICVDACPLRALDFGDIGDLRARYGSNSGIAPLPEPRYTRPNITIKACTTADVAGNNRGFVANPKEVM